MKRQITSRDDAGQSHGVRSAVPLPENVSPSLPRAPTRIEAAISNTRLRPSSKDRILAVSLFVRQRFLQVRALRRSRVAGRWFPNSCGEVFVNGACGFATGRHGEDHSGAPRHDVAAGKNASLGGAKGLLIANEDVSLLVGLQVWRGGLH